MGTGRPKIFHLLLLSLSFQTSCGIPAVFLDRPAASGMLLRRERRANSLFEELKLGDLERECLEEKCSYEEAREIFSIPENFVKEDACTSGPCQNGATCVDHFKSYSCICPPGFEGRNCEMGMKSSFGCLYKNGDCEHFCTEAPGLKHHCHCAPGYALGSDNSSCEPQVPFPCGKVVPNPSETFTPRIVKGSVCPKGECPWQASFFTLITAMLEYGSKYMCGGIILDTAWVLTAAHCIWGSQASLLKVTVGEHIRSIHEGTEQVRKVAKMIIHPQYNHSSSDNDLALLRLAEEVQFDRFVVPVCLPTLTGEFVRVTLANIRTSVVSGWGRLSQFGPESAVLRRLEVPRVSLNECKAQTKLPLTNNMLCAGFLAGQKDSCQGDSGGPLVTLYKKTWFLSGVVSWGKGCAQSGFYGIYTRVANYLRWINSTMAAV
ncbi:coagulation factor VII-like [Arapaima gigas]